jgi:ribonuclease HI
MRQVTIFTDGACKGNPGPGGFGVILACGPHRHEISQGYRRTTNNRMEMLAAIVGLEALKEPCAVQLHSDSRYVIDALTKNWIKGWKAKGWKTSTNQPVKNQDLWLRLTEAAAKHQVEWKWVRGHAGHVENERCDELAVAAAIQREKFEDVGFEG